MGEERVQKSARSLSMKCVVLMDDMCLQLNIDLKDDYLILVREGNNRADVIVTYQIPDLFSNNINKLRPLLHCCYLSFWRYHLSTYTTLNLTPGQRFLHGRTRDVCIPSLQPLDLYSRFDKLLPQIPHHVALAEIVL